MLNISLLKLPTASLPAALLSQRFLQRGWTARSHTLLWQLRNWKAKGCSFLSNASANLRSSYTNQIATAADSSGPDQLCNSLKSSFFMPQVFARHEQDFYLVCVSATNAAVSVCSVSPTETVQNTISWVLRAGCETKQRWGLLMIFFFIPCIQLLLSTGCHLTKVFPF